MRAKREITLLALKDYAKPLKRLHQEFFLAELFPLPCVVRFEQKNKHGEVLLTATGKEVSVRFFEVSRKQVDKKSKIRRLTSSSLKDN